MTLHLALEHIRAALTALERARVAVGEMRAARPKSLETFLPPWKSVVAALAVARSCAVEVGSRVPRVSSLYAATKSGLDHPLLEYFAAASADADASIKLVLGRPSFRDLVYPKEHPKAGAPFPKDSRGVQVVSGDVEIHINPSGYVPGLAPLQGGKLEPPKMHLGIELPSDDPLGAADLAIVYYYDALMQMEAEVQAAIRV